jgi:hypothetical protein
MRDNDPAGNTAFVHLAFVVDPRLVARFFLLLQQGVRIRRRIGCTVEVFLREELGAAPDTINKIQSIMLDGKPVDDIGSAVVHEGSFLALSAAMPGLVGATLRRGGAYSSFRSVITYHEEGTVCAPKDGWVGIKLFNQMMAELGPGLLRMGVLVKANDLTEMLAERGPELQQGCSAKLDGKPFAVGTLAGNTALAGKEQVLLTVVDRAVID